uniref:WD_REPEATS_REGION domain-containing protein n=1 Tax=Globodera pallida TaxID=36090 RepID=A0A183C8Z9_GLOPA
MTSHTPEWKNGGVGGGHGIRSTVLTSLNSTTPSRNPNYVKGKVNEGDRYVCLRSEEQLELANHLLSSRLLDAENTNKLNTSTSCPTSPASKLEQQTKKQMMRVKSDNAVNTLADFDRVCAFRKGLAPLAKFAGERSLLEMKDFTDLRSHPTFVKWSCEGQYLAVGFNDGQLKLLDTVTKKVLRTIHTAADMRLACATWTHKGRICCGSKNGRIYHHDVRIQNSLISTLEAHTHEVCGLKWSPDEHFLTSGGSDAVVNVWENVQLSENNPASLFKFDDHISTVKAIEYVPTMGLGPANLVATGGGTRDHTIRFWNLTDGNAHFTLDTQSQVSGILFNKPYGEMITGHGAPKAGVRVWHHEPNKIKKFEQTAELNQAQGGRVLALCQSPCGEYVIAANQDEVLRIWHVWKMDESMRKQTQESVTANARKQLQYTLNGGPTAGNIIR